MLPSSTQIPFGKGLFARSVLIDTGAFIALADTKDKFHKEAVDCLGLIAKNRLPLFVTVPTIYETQRNIIHKLGLNASRNFLDSIYDGSHNIVRTIEEDDIEAKKLIEKYASLELTLTDSVNMVIMLKIGIAKVFSFDRHFLQAGFIRIPPF